MANALSLEARLDAALTRREDLLQDPTTEALRLFHGRADGLEALVIEKWGSILIVQLLEGLRGPSPDELRPHLQRWCERLGATAVYLKHFVRDRAGTDVETRDAHCEPTPWLGEPAPEEFPIREGELTFLIRPYDGFSVGLFLEHRENRRRIAELSAGRRVLNTFAYTCGFSVAAAKGGAASVASVDLSKRYLEWGKRSFAANGLPLDPHRFYTSDIFEFLRRARRQNLRYDLAILDPPTFFAAADRPPSSNSAPTCRGSSPRPSNASIAEASSFSPSMTASSASKPWNPSPSRPSPSAARPSSLALRCHRTSPGTRNTQKPSSSSFRRVGIAHLGAQLALRTAIVAFEIGVGTPGPGATSSSMVGNAHPTG